MQEKILFVVGWKHLSSEHGFNAYVVAIAPSGDASMKRSKPMPEIWQRLNDLIDVCFSQTNCPECLREWQDKRGCKKKCRVNKAILYMRDLANGRKVLYDFK